MDTRTKTIAISQDGLRMIFGTLIPISPDEEIIAISYKNNHLTYVVRDLNVEPEELEAYSA